MNNRLESSFESLVDLNEIADNQLVKKQLTVFHGEITDFLVLQSYEKIVEKLEGMYAYLNQQNLSEQAKLLFKDYATEASVLTKAQLEEEHSAIAAVEEELQTEQDALTAAQSSTQVSQKKAGRGGFFDSVKTGLQQVGDFFTDKGSILGVSFGSLGLFRSDSVLAPIKDTALRIKEFMSGVVDNVKDFFDKNSDENEKKDENETNNENPTPIVRTPESVREELEIESSIEYNPSVKYTKNQFIGLIKPLAKEIEQKFGIPAPIVVAQASLESGLGNSRLAREGYNFFGFTKGSSRPHEVIALNENYDNSAVKFRKYTSIEESFFNYAQVLKNASRYSKLFTYSKTDYKKRAEGLLACGYATDPNYAKKLISFVESNNLQPDQSTHV